MKFYFQKLKKTCAVCEAIIDGVYYCGQDNKILCETHYKVVSGLGRIKYFQDLFPAENAGQLCPVWRDSGRKHFED